jgi:UDP-N-acetylglucosamine 4,6-dehydratase
MVIIKEQNLTNLFKDSDVLVTGGTGSFGKAAIKIILNQLKPKRLIVFSRDEFKQFSMSNEIKNSDKKRIRFFIGDIRDKERLVRAMKNVKYVIHAAAMKHVNACEYNPMEAIKTNVIGAENIINTAIDCGVKKVIALSTDKAANPSNLYGATKLCSDKLFIAANNLAGNDLTKFSVVRYGNVLGSRGSVVEIFKKMLEQGNKFIPITHPDMTRFWITLEQGVNFVISSFLGMKGGEVFIPKIPSMKVTDLAKCIAPKIKQKIIGIRPGEKLHEMMITKEDALSTFEFSDRYIILPNSVYKYKNRKYLYNKIKGKKVRSNFEYSSNNNSEWLNNKSLKKMLK